MATEKKKLVRITSPAGTARYPWLNNPDTQFNVDGVYKVNLLIPNADAKELCKVLDEHAAAAFADAKAQAKNPALAKQITLAYPYAPFLDEAGEDTGMTEFKFKMNAKITTFTGETKTLKPFIFDAKGKNLPVCPAVYGGSKLKINFCPAGYYAASSKQAGVSLRMNAVQILELVSGGGGNASGYGFGTEEGSFEGETAPVMSTEGSSDF